MLKKRTVFCESRLLVENYNILRTEYMVQYVVAVCKYNINGEVVAVWKYNTIAQPYLSTR